MQNFWLDLDQTDKYNCLQYGSMEGLKYSYTNQ